MNDLEAVRADLDRLIETAARVHTRFTPATATRAEIDAFLSAFPSVAGSGLAGLWLAADGELPLLPPDESDRSVYTSNPLGIVRRDWLGGDPHEVTPRFGPDAGKTFTYSDPGDQASGLLKFASDAGGDALHIATIDVEQGPAGAVFRYHHGSDEFTFVSATFAAFLRRSVDLAASEVDRAFFYGDPIERIFRFPGTAELTRQLANGLSPRYRRGLGSGLVERAVDCKRPDLFAPLIAAGAPVYDALKSMASGVGSDMLEPLLAGGADPNHRLPDGTPILLRAVKARRIDMVEVLLRHGADGSVTDLAGRTALSLAAARPDDWKMRRIAELLRAAGAAA